MEYKYKLLLVLLTLDFIWIGIIANKFYMNKIKQVQGYNMSYSKDKIIKSIIVYSFILYLLLQNKFKSNSEKFLLGISVYGIFNFTNSIMFNAWDSKVSIIDTLWGGTLFVIAPLLTNKLLVSCI